MLFKKIKNRFLKKSRQTLQEKYPEYSIGRSSYGNPAIHSWGDEASLEIGSFTSIAPGVQIFLCGEHRVDWVTTFPFNILWEQAREISGHPTTKGDVRIGNDVWLATESVVMSGVTIGDGAVIGARTVVSKNVAPYSIVVGNPGKVVNKRFDDKTIALLLEIEWWNWDDSKIIEAFPLLMNNRIDDFLKFSQKDM